MTNPHRDNGKSSARLRLVISDETNGSTDAAADEQAQLESELALERRQMRRDLAAKLLDEHHKRLATTGAPRSAPANHQVELRNESRGQATSTLELVNKGLRQETARPAKRESRAPLLAALFVGSLLVVSYLVWDTFIDPATSAATRLSRALVAIPIIWAGAIAAALVSNAIVTKLLRETERERAANSEIDRLELELEMALERRQMRRALAATLVDEYRNNPAQVPAKALRTALVTRDLTEEECEALDRALSKARNRSDNTGQTS